MFAFRWKPGVTEKQKLRVAAEIRGLQGRFRLSGNSRRREYFLAWTRVRVWRRDEIRRQGLPLQLRPASGASRMVSWLMPLIEPVEVDFELSP